MTLLSRIQRDLLDFTDQDPEDFSDLVEFWYLANSEALSAALTAHQGINLILNVRSFSNFELLAKRLFLLADTLLLRDTRDWASDKSEYRAIPMPTGSPTGQYRPGFLADSLKQLQKLPPSPLTLLYRPNLYWSSSTKILNNGLEVAYAAWDYHSLPTEALAWISGPGREYIATGQVIFAPFIPSLEMELEFLAKHQVSLPAQFGAQSLFHQQHEWLRDDRLQALLSLQFPFLDGLDISTISKIKEDNYDAFSVFSRTILESVNGVKSAAGTEGFIREVRNIQRNQVDAALSDVQKTLHRVKQSSALRKKGILTGLLGLNAAALIGIPEATLVTGLAAGAAALIADRAAQLKESGDLGDKKGYFLWLLQNAASDQSGAA